MQMVGHFSVDRNETAPNRGILLYLMGASCGWPRILSGQLGVGPILWTPLFPLSSECGAKYRTTGRYTSRVTTYYSGVPIWGKRF